MADDPAPNAPASITPARDLPAPRDPSTRLLVLDRQGCHLCEQALATVRAEADRAGLAVETRDVDEDPRLAAAWGEDVPVVILDGQVIARYHIDPATLRRAIAPGPRWARLLPERRRPRR